MFQHSYTHLSHTAAWRLNAQSQAVLDQFATASTDLVRYTWLLPMYVVKVHQGMSFLAASHR